MVESQCSLRDLIPPDFVLNESPMAAGEPEYLLYRDYEVGRDYVAHIPEVGWSTDRELLTGAILHLYQVARQWRDENFPEVSYKCPTCRVAGWRYRTASEHLSRQSSESGKMIRMVMCDDMVPCRLCEGTGTYVRASQAGLAASDGGG